MDTVEWAIDSSVFNAKMISEACVTLADELDALAAVCEQCTLGYDRYVDRRSTWGEKYALHSEDRHRFDHPGRIPTPPPDPPSWVTRG